MSSRSICPRDSKAIVAGRIADCVAADFTVTIGFAKQGLLADQALDYVGRIEAVRSPIFRRRRTHRPPLAVATAASLRPLLRRRDFGTYKNQCGRVGILAGSKGFTGAALLCSLGALRAGAGLVELFVPEEIYQIVASAAPPEVMVKTISSYRALAEESIDVWAVGPGLGPAHAEGIVEFMSTITQPMVIDADGLNILAEQMPLLQNSRGPRLLTPHPGEMKRLFPRAGVSRAQLAREFCAQYDATLLLKGSRTIVAERDQPLSYNPTGNPGMATGGMGDVLTGVCAALIAQQLAPYGAARLGAWLCGRAAEIAIFNDNDSEQSFSRRDVLAHLGAAFKRSRQKRS